MMDFLIETPETDLDQPCRVKLAREIRVKVQSLTPAPGTVELYCDRALKFTGTLAATGTSSPKINKFKLPPECRGKYFYMRIIGGAGIAMQAHDAAITEFKLLPPGAI